VNPLHRLALQLALVAALVFVLADGAVAITLHTGGIMVIWPVDAVILALMLGPFRDRPLLPLLVAKLSGIAGEFCGGNGWMLSFGLPLASAVSTLAIFMVLRKASNRNLATSRLLLLFLLVSAVASLQTSWSGSWLLHWATGAPEYKLFVTGAASNAVGYAVITPLLSTLFHGDLRLTWRGKQTVTAAAVAIAYGAAVVAIFAQSDFPLLFPIPIGLMLVAYTSDLAVVALMVLFTALTAYVFTLTGSGPIVLSHGSLHTKILMLQVFLAFITATSLPIAALMAEHRRVKASLVMARIEAEAANDAKSVFLATISHEIRTPLNGVLGMAQAMSLDELSPAQTERLKVLHRSGETLLSLLNDVLDLAKIEAGKMTFECLDFDLGELVRGAVANFQALAAEKGLELGLDMGAGEGVYRGDPTRVRQILFNLIGNALKFTSHGRIQIECRFGLAGLDISISDTGIGIPADRIGSLFAKFTQVDDSTTRRFGGTGLGLSICGELANLMGGRIEVQSVEGRGSRFTVKLPLERVGDSAPPEPTAKPPVMVLAPGLRVLAAEDNATNQLVLRRLLEFAGVDVVIVENGLMAVEAWQNAEWDLILMDVHMPVLDGPSAVKAIRAREAEQRRRRTPIVALTANTLTHQVQSYLDGGMDAHLAKPIQVEALFAIIGDASERALAVARDVLPDEARVTDAA
jgi:signal transduction histidine kinase/CheY-like chemotaxis protein